MNWRKVVAYHEAGHAVVGVVLGNRISELWIASDDDPVDGPLGQCRSVDAFSDPHDSIAMTWSGVIAEAIATGECAPLTETDRAHLIAAARCLPDATPYWSDYTALSRAFGMQWRARALVQQHWSAIEQVARTLLQAGRLDGSTVHRLVNGSSSGFAVEAPGAALTAQSSYETVPAMSGSAQLDNTWLVFDTIDEYVVARATGRWPPNTPALVLA